MLPTQDHNIIRTWAARKNATPAEISPIKFDGEPAILTPEIRPISWDAFFAQFDLLELSFAHDHRSSYFELVRVEKRSNPCLAPG